MSLFDEIDKFKKWEKDENPAYSKYGEWECDYQYWNDIYHEIDALLNQEELNLSNSQIDDLLYIIARDNECEIIAEKLSRNVPFVISLANYAISSLHSDSKWQLVKILSPIPGEEIDEIIYKLSFDRLYYTQRICMMESAKRKSKYAKEMIEWAWITADEYQRISALWSLVFLNDPELPEYLKRALNSENTYLKKNAEEIEASNKANSADAKGRAAD